VSVVARPGEGGSLLFQAGAVLWRGPRAVVVSGRSGAGARVRVVAWGADVAVEVGGVYEARGRFRSSARHGEQFHADASSLVPTVPPRSLELSWLQRFPGLGPERAARLLRAFAGRLGHALSGGVPLEEVAAAIDPLRPNLATRVAAVVAEAWRSLACEHATVRWLDERGVVDLALARRVAALLGPGGVEALQRNPYVLAAVLPWERLDPLALGVLRSLAPTDDVATRPERIVGAIDALLLEAVSQGHTAVSKRGFAEAVAKRLDPLAPRALVERVEATGLANRAVVDGGDLWRVPGCAVMEDEVAARLASMAAGRDGGRGTARREADLRRVLAMVERRGGTLFPEQREAVLKLVRASFGCLTGGAGTGKTTTCRAVVDLWEALGGRVELAAVSGKAALRLGAAVGRVGPSERPALTVFRLLMGLRKRRDEGATHWCGSSDPGSADPALELPRLDDGTLLVVDEASMLDLGQLHQIVEAVPSGCGLLLVGDAYQLPPVGFGLPFHHLARQPGVTAALEVVRRHDEATGIPAVSRAVRDGVVPTLPAYRPGLAGASFLAVAQGGVTAGVARVVSDADALGRLGRDALVVTAVNTRPQRPDGTADHVNVCLQRERRARSAGGDAPAPAVAGAFGEVFSVGDPVIHVRNDYEADLRNGSLGVVLEADPARGLVCGFDGVAHRFGRAAVADLRLAYALSCHRAQGSQARLVVVSLADTPMLDPNWLYTALTRAEETVVLVGTPGILGRVMTRPPAHERRVTGCAFEIASSA
jgi:exodeoxyribonuclease V alpha subunit